MMRYRAIFALSYAALLYERLWSSFWPAVSVVAAYAGLCLMNAGSLLGDAGQAGLLALFSLAFLYALDRLGRPFRFPSAAEVERRIEHESALAHRPLAALADRPAGKISGETCLLWEKHLQRLSGAKARLRPCRPKPDVARQDRHALRFGALLLLVVGVVAAGDGWRARLGHGFAPPMPSPLAENALALDVWIVPPEYTRAAPVFLASSQGAAVARGAVAVPEGSVLKARMTGRQRAPRLRYAGASHAFTRASDKSHILELPLERGGRLLVRHGIRELGAWQVGIIPDAPPALEIVGVQETGRALTKITYRGKDDYGLAKIEALVVPEDSGAPHGDPAPVVLALPLPGGEGLSTHTADLTAHIHAGGRATLFLTAQDAVGHVVAADPYSFILPERDFTNPMAERLVLERKKLVWADNALALAAIAHRIADMNHHPAAYNGDFVTFLALGTAARRLLYEGDGRSVRSVQGLLWDLALRMEDGGLSAAARELSESLQRLSAMLDDPGLSAGEMREMLEQVEQKMQQYMQALAQELAQRLQDGAHMPVMSPEIAQKFTKNIDLGEMMRQLREMAQNNPREAMKQMAEMLKNAVDNIDIGRIERMREQQVKAMRALEDLQDIIRRQQSLMDRTARLDPGSDGAQEADEQDALRRDLGGAMRALGESLPEIPANLGKADRAMQRAQDGFRGEQGPRGALPHQKAALNALQKGMDDAIGQMAQGMQQVILSFGGGEDGGGNYGEGYDPLGRKDGGKHASDDVKIPDERERRRVQQIIRELRDRSNDFQRPKVERDYIDRLLDPME